MLLITFRRCVTEFHPPKIERPSLFLESHNSLRAGSGVLAGTNDDEIGVLVLAPFLSPISPVETRKAGEDDGAATRMFSPRIRSTMPQ